LAKKDFITCQEWTKEELETVLETAFDLKRKLARGEPHELLRGKTLVMMFYNPSTRTRNSFETGMTQLGGHAIFLSSGAAWVDSESIKDTAEVLSRYADALAIRYLRWQLPFGECNRVLRLYAKYASIPVINMEDGMYHPCQGMADLMTIKEKFNNIEGKKFVLSWAYSSYFGGYLGSECHTNTLLMSRFGMDVTLAYPEGFDVDPSIVNFVKSNAEAAGSTFEIVHDMKEAFEGAHVVYPVNWPPWKLISAENDLERKKRIILEYTEKYKNWICTQELMDVTDKHSIFMHCMPFKRGEEVTEEVADGPHSVIYDEAENRLHVQKALLALLIGGL